MKEMNMLLEFGLTILAGVILGGAANWLSSQLPQLNAGEMDDNEPDILTHSRTRLGIPACAHCDAPLNGIQWLTALAYLTRRNVCTQCGTPLRMRSLVVEISMSLLMTYIWSRGGDWTHNITIALYTWIFFVIALIDIDYRLVLNIVTIPAFVVGLIEIIISDRLLMRSALLGYAVAQISVMGIYLLGGIYLLWLKTRQGETIDEIPFGMGDVTLATLCGMIVGFPSVIFMLLLMMLLGGGLALVHLITSFIHRKKQILATPFAYGPAIVMAATILLIWPEIPALWLGSR
jgi:leader peptidase (prepilin peptidase)/N-methyltransferase